MVLGKDSHQSLQRPRHSLKPEPTSPRLGFTVSPHGLRQGLTPEPAGHRQGHTLKLWGPRQALAGPQGPRQDLILQKRA